MLVADFAFEVGNGDFLLRDDFYFLLYLGKSNFYPAEIALL